MVNRLALLELRSNIAFRLALLLCPLFFWVKPAPSQNTPVTRLAVSREVAVGGHWCDLLRKKASEPRRFLIQAPPLTLVSLVKVPSGKGENL